MFWDEQNVQDVNEQILEKFQRIDILINAAGGHVPKAVIGVNENVFNLEFKYFKEVTDVNLNGTVLPTLVFGKTMAKQKKRLHH